MSISLEDATLECSLDAIAAVEPVGGWIVREYGGCSGSWVRQAENYHALYSSIFPMSVEIELCAVGRPQVAPSAEAKYRASYSLQRSVVLDPQNRAMVPEELYESFARGPSRERLILRQAGIQIVISLEHERGLHNLHCNRDLSALLINDLGRVGSRYLTHLLHKQGRTRRQCARAAAYSLFAGMLIAFPNFEQLLDRQGH